MDTGNTSNVASELRHLEWKTHEFNFIPNKEIISITEREDVTSLKLRLCKLKINDIVFFAWGHVPDRAHAGFLAEPDTMILAHIVEAKLNNVKFIVSQDVTISNESFGYEECCACSDLVPIPFKSDLAYA